MARRTPPSPAVIVVLRVVGVALLLTALFLIAMALRDFFVADPDVESGAPSGLWRFFVAVPIFLVGGFCLQAGYLGAMSRFAARETAPALRESGRAFRGDDPSDRAGSFCSACGARARSGAAFCDSCGQSLG